MPIRRKLMGDALAKKASRAMKQAGLTLDDLLADLQRQRERFPSDSYPRGSRNADKKRHRR